MNWQPIDTAPKDGTRILLFLPDYNVRIWIGDWYSSKQIRNGAVVYEREGWSIGTMPMWGDNEPKPTWWAPLPEEPSP